MSEAALPLADPNEWRPSFNPWIIALSVMLATFMEVLDTSIANVALPHIAGSLAADVNSSTWALTSYLVANAIVLPSTAWLSGVFGRKRFLIACIGIFTFASALCGAATSLPMLIAARVLQGAGGGALQPIAQAVLLESFPPRKRGAAMAATQEAYGILYRQMQSQAGLWAYIHDFRILGALCLCCVPLAFLFKRISYRKSAGMAH
jgi:DHA2 family multidrug resistance protein